MNTQERDALLEEIAQVLDSKAEEHGRVSKWMDAVDRTEARLARSIFREAAQVVRSRFADNYRDSTAGKADYEEES